MKTTPGHDERVTSEVWHTLTDKSQKKKTSFLCVLTFTQTTENAGERMPGRERRPEHKETPRTCTLDTYFYYRAAGTNK